MKRLGIIDLDTSHAAAFVSRVNHVGVEKDQWVDGAQFVVGCQGKSVLAPERLGPETAAVKKLGLPLVETPEEMLKHNLDAVFIEGNGGTQHLERVEFFTRRGLPVFVDKPFACSSADARAMIDLAAKAKTPIFSSSSLRYAPEVVAFKKAANNPAGISAIAYGPAVLHPKNPGLFNYGIHPVEMLFALMGPGIEQVSCSSVPNADVVTGVWKDGRIGVVRGGRPSSDYGFVTFSDGRTTCQSVSTKYIYRELLKEILAMIETGVPPIDPKETLEIIRFIELAFDSSNNHAAPRRA